MDVARGCVAALLTALLVAAPLPGRCAPPRGRVMVLGPASTMSRFGASRTAARRAPRCDVYGGISGGAGPSPTSFDIAATEIQPPGSGPSLGPVTAALSATGSSLLADTGLGSASLPVNGTPIVRTVQNLAEVATTPYCSSGSLVLTLTSSPAAPSGDVIATLAGQQMVLGYRPNFVYEYRATCYYANRPWRTFSCDLWRLDVDLTLSAGAIPGAGAGSYQLDITQTDVSAR